MALRNDPSKRSLPSETIKSIQNLFIWLISILISKFHTTNDANVPGRQTAIFYFQ